MRYILLLLLLNVLISCKPNDHQEIQPGYYRATLEVQDNKEMPFNFNIDDAGIMEIYNGEEVIEVDDITYYNDSIRINFPVYEGYITGKFKNGMITEAKFIKES